MNDLYSRIEAWFEERDVTLGFQRGIDDIALDAAEERLGFALPAEVRASFCARNGQSADHFYGPEGPRILFTDMRFYSLFDLLSEWEEWKSGHHTDGYDDLYAGEKIRNAISHPKRLPFASQESITWLFIDLIPGPKGSEGQLLFNTTECDMALVGTSVADFLERYLKLIESGRLSLVEKDDRKVIIDSESPDTDGYAPFVLAE